MLSSILFCLKFHKPTKKQINRHKINLIREKTERTKQNAMVLSFFKLIDVLEIVITIQNSQLIEIYIPNFKLSRDFLKSENKQNWNIICETKSYVWYKEFRSLTFNFIEIA